MYMKYFFLDLAKSCNDKCIQRKISKFYVHNMTIGLGQIITILIFPILQKILLIVLIILHVLHLI